MSEIIEEFTELRTLVKRDGFNFVIIKGVGSTGSLMMHLKNRNRTNIRNTINGVSSGSLVLTVNHIQTTVDKLTPLPTEVAPIHLAQDGKVISGNPVGDYFCFTYIHNVKPEGTVRIPDTLEKVYVENSYTAPVDGHIALIYGSYVDTELKLIEGLQAGEEIQVAEPSCIAFLSDAYIEIPNE